MRKRRFKFLTSCVGVPYRHVPALHNMIDNAIEVTYRTFFKYVDLREVARGFGYELDSRRGLTLRDDWHVTYHRSKFRGRLCYYLRHSGIEHIYVEQTGS